MRPAGGHVGRLYLLSSIFASSHFSLLLCLTCLFFTFPCSWLTLHVSWAFPIVCGLLFIPTVIFFLFTSFTDTGILRKGIEEELLNQAVVIRAPRQHWCNRCQLHSLPHTFHCAWCNTCVEEFDHHCMWLNNCIGRYNIRCFFLFVVFLSSYNLVVMSSCLTYLVLNNQQPFNVEKICTIVVTIPTAFYLLPLLIQLISQLSNIWTTWYRCKLQAGKKKNSWPLNTTDGSTEIPIPEMPESLQLLDEDQDTHWKCQLYINRRGPPSPTGTLLSLTDI
ncbi:palmitoyltransferase ZDHHC19 [Sphaerodactylus townsendi]|uniref:palmitoyltransferase ZDHHC19 n=1 Tax=Sphaerodactylus townsendi TaxID=933632 RepID=UPI0020268AFD|nr:palmitoyltransferase ZDHHC19 [Sphaerodactylus townsendi]